MGEARHPTAQRAWKQTPTATSSPWTGSNQAKTAASSGESRQAAVQNKAWGARKDHGEPSAAKTTIAPRAKRDEIPRTLVSGARNEHVESSVTKTTMAPWAKREEKPNTSVSDARRQLRADAPAFKPMDFPTLGGGSSSASKGDTLLKAGAWGKQNPQAADVSTRSAWGTVTKSSSSPSTTGVEKPMENIKRSEGVERTQPSPWGKGSSGLKVALTASPWTKGATQNDDRISSPGNIRNITGFKRGLLHLNSTWKHRRFNHRTFQVSQR